MSCRKEIAVPSSLLLFIMMLISGAWAQSQVYECPPPRYPFQIGSSEMQRMSLTYNETTRTAAAKFQLKDGTEATDVPCPNAGELNPDIYICPVSANIDFHMKLDPEAHTCIIAAVGVTEPTRKKNVRP